VTTVGVDVDELEAKVKDMYRQVAEHPEGAFHFELGAALALRLGYDAARISALPREAVDSFAGVGYALDLAALEPGDTVLDLGSGSGMDVFYAAGLVGPTGRVVGVDFTVEQLAKARRLAATYETVDFREGRIEALPMADDSVDCVISNGVINLSPDKESVFAEAARVLRPGGRLAVADIITERPYTEAIVCNPDLWAACIGGAAQQEVYLQAIESAGFTVQRIRVNDYRFISDRAQSATRTYGVKSVSVLAVLGAGRSWA
jgi:arsenite methyltransferase